MSSVPVPATTRSGRTLATAIVAVVAVLATLAAPASAAVPRRWLVTSGADLPAGATVVAELPVAGMSVVSSVQAPAGAVAADTALTWHTLPAADGADGNLDSGVTSTRAEQVWTQTRGERAVVALIDTGVAPVPALEGAVAGELDFTDTGGGDGHGHGTFMASLIAGRGPIASGVAPGAGVVSLKVGKADGSTDLQTVLGALQWLHGHGRGLGIRVAVLALGVDASTPAAHVLDAATERLAKSGVLVVTASGNTGPDELTSPATSPGTLSVGAVDDGGTGARADDVAAGFSATGPDRVGAAQPDLVASGVRVVGSVAPDALIAAQNPEAIVGEGLLRGSGTSVSAALTAGVAALASSARPDLDGPGLEAAVRAGAGELDAVDTVDAALAASQHPGQRNGKANGIAAGEKPRQPAWQGPAWEPVQWNAASWGAASWGAASWGAASWGAASWGAASWGAASWGLLSDPVS